jgi:hypothetical protein
VRDREVRAVRTGLRFLALLALVVALLASGCAKQYVITKDLAVPLESPARVRVGAIADELPATVDEEDKPSAEDIEKFRRYLTEELRSIKSDIQVIQAGDAAYEVTGGIMQYTQGSGFLRFLIGFGAGSAKVLTELKVVEVATGNVVFGGNFEGSVSSWAETGDEMFRKVARNFAKEIERQQKNLAG